MIKTYWRNIGSSRGKTDNINIQKLHRREGNMSFSDSCHLCRSANRDAGFGLQNPWNGGGGADEPTEPAP